MIQWISVQNKYPDATKWVLVWDGKHIYPVLWQAPIVSIQKAYGNNYTHLQKGYFKDMVGGHYAQNVSHWAELPLNPDQSLNPSLEAPESEIIRVTIEQALEKALNQLRDKGKKYLTSTKDEDEDEDDE